MDVRCTRLDAIACGQATDLEAVFRTDPSVDGTTVSKPSPSRQKNFTRQSRPWCAIPRPGVRGRLASSAAGHPAVHKLGQPGLPTPAASACGREARGERGPSMTTTRRCAWLTGAALAAAGLLAAGAAAAARHHLDRRADRRRRRGRGQHGRGDGRAQPRRRGRPRQGVARGDPAGVDHQPPVHRAGDAGDRRLDDGRDHRAVDFGHELEQHRRRLQRHLAARIQGWAVQPDLRRHRVRRHQRSHPPRRRLFPGVHDRIRRRRPRPWRGRRPRPGELRRRGALLHLRRHRHPQPGAEADLRPVQHPPGGDHDPNRRHPAAGRPQGLDQLRRGRVRRRAQPERRRRVQPVGQVRPAGRRQPVDHGVRPASVGSLPLRGFGRPGRDLAAGPSLREGLLDGRRSRRRA